MGSPPRFLDLYPARGAEIGVNIGGNLLQRRSSHPIIDETRAKSSLSCGALRGIAADKDIQVCERPKVDPSLDPSPHGEEGLDLLPFLHSVGKGASGET